MVHGRPLAITDSADTVPAILDTWYLGHPGPYSFAEHTFMGNGTEVVAQIKEICDKRIAPLFSAAHWKRPTRV